MSSSLVAQLKLKCLMKKPAHGDIIEAKDFTFNSFLKIYRGKLVLRN